MIEERAKVFDQDVALMERRVFLATTLGAAALIMAPLFTRKAYAQREDVLGWTSRFTRAIGGVSRSSLVSQYLARLPARVRDEVISRNDDLYRGGFTDMNHAVVHGFSDYFFYPAVTANHSNLCVPFFDMNSNRSRAYVTMVEGPTLIGLARAAEYYANENGSQAAQRLLLPRHRVLSSEGGFKQGYKTPDVYYTGAGEGRVEVDYDTDGDGTGTVHVTASKVNSRSLLLNKEFPISYMV